MARRLTSNAICALIAGALQACLAAPIAAQSSTPPRLAPKATLSAIGPAGCMPVPPAAAVNGAPLSARDAADSARALIASGQDAALQGDHAAARDAFLLASRLAPSNARVAYYLGREYEDLGEVRNATKEYCRYLSLLPTAADGDEVRGRIQRLTPPAEIVRSDEARAAFRSGVNLLQQRHLVAADSAFSQVIRTLPGAGEAYYNRALARAARGERNAAIQDFERYMQLSPGAADHASIRSAMTRLQDRVWDASSVFWQGLIAPGVGQMSTGRPIRGVFILAMSGGIVAAGLTSKSDLQTNEYVDPFGNPYIDTVRVTERPYLVPAASVVAAVWLLSAFEASAFARGSLARARGIIASAVDPNRSTSPVTLLLRPDTNGRVAVGLNLRR